MHQRRAATSNAPMTMPGKKPAANDLPEKVFDGASVTIGCAGLPLIAVEAGTSVLEDILEGAEVLELGIIVALLLSTVVLEEDEPSVAGCVMHILPWQA